MKKTRFGLLLILFLLAILVIYEWNSAMIRSKMLEEGKPLPPDPFPITLETPWWLIPFYTLGNYLSKAWICLTIAFLIAGAIETFIPKQLIIKHLSNKNIKSYLIAAVGGPMLSVCSCSIIPIFAGIYRRGAGLGPALAFLLAAPAINPAAILLTGSMIGWNVALGRIILAVSSAIIVSFIVGGVIFKKMDGEFSGDRLKVEVLDENFEVSSLTEWIKNTWIFVKKIIPLILIGIIIVGVIKVVLTPEIIASYLGQGVLQTVLASAMGVIIYTPTLVEVPFIRGLIEMGMATGPAIAFLLTGPALSLPSVFGVTRVISWKVVLTYALLMFIMGVIGGLIFAYLVPSLNIY
ncbi:MAG: permease [Candidatus Aenigmatarchaeota archaeon]